MSSLVHDLRYAIRVLTRSPGFTLVAVIVLAAGIGANSAVFTVANALLFRPVEAGELVGLYSRDRERPDRYRAFSCSPTQTTWTSATAATRSRASWRTR